MSVDATPTAAILVVGDELLDGFVAEANSFHLARRLREVGIRLNAVVIVRDDVEGIAAELSRLLEGPRPRVVFTTGGVGGTADDVTYSAVGRALGRPLETSASLAVPVQEIIDWAASKGFDFDDQAVAAMMRIATVPEGSRVLQSDTYLAGVVADVDGGFAVDTGASVVMLPGPPGHCQAVVDRLVVPDLLEGRGRTTPTQEVEHDYPETILAGALSRIRDRHPDVSVGSYPGDRMVVRFQGRREAIAAAAREFESELERLDAHPAAEKLRRAWRQQIVDWDAGAS